MGSIGANYRTAKRTSYAYVAIGKGKCPAALRTGCGELRMLRLEPGLDLVLYQFRINLIGKYFRSRRVSRPVELS